MSENPYLRLRALVTGDGAYAGLTEAEAAVALNAPVAQPAAHRDVPISDVEGYLRARLLVTRLRAWAATATFGTAREAALELLDIIASPRLSMFMTSTETGRSNIMGLFAALVAATDGIVTQQHYDDLLAMTLKPTAYAIPREQIGWPSNHIWAADVNSARAMEG
jgi:hypothetical protein